MPAGSGEVHSRKGHSSLHQKGVRQEARTHLALHCGEELWSARAADFLSELLSLDLPGDDFQGSCCAGSYVTHETKHFIYFYLGEY